MKTLVDFITHTKGIEYLLAIGAIVGYALFVEFLKPRPFAGLLSSAREDARFMANEGRGKMLTLAKNLAKAPFVAGAYIAALPFYFVMGMMLKAEGALSNVVGGGSMAWRPLESYLTGRKRGKKRVIKTPAEKDQEVETE